MRGYRLEGLDWFRVFRDIRFGVEGSFGLSKGFGDIGFGDIGFRVQGSGI